MDWARLQKLESLVQQAIQFARRSIAALVGISRIQAGLSVMVNGLTPVIPVDSLVAGSTIVVSYKVLNGNANTVELAPTAYVLGTPGSFRVEALAAGGAGNAADQSTVSWQLINP